MNSGSQAIISQAEAKLSNILSFAFVQSSEMENKQVSLKPVHIQKYEDR